MALGDAVSQLPNAENNLVNGWSENRYVRKDAILLGG